MVRARTVRVVDFLAAACAILTLWTRTPTGELLGRAGRLLTGAPGRSTPLFQFFQTGAGSPEPIFATTGTDDRVLAVARVAGKDSALVMAFALSTQGVKGVQSTDVALPEAGRSLLLSRGAREAELSTPAGRLSAVARELPRLADELGSDEAAILALVVGIEDARFAARRAAAEGRTADLESLLAHVRGGYRDRARSVLGGTLAVARALELAWPVDPRTVITSGFGERRNPFSGRKQMHGGLDLSVPEGTAVRAAADGVVIRAGEDGINGRFLVIDHGRGVTSAYCHNRALLAFRGDEVKRGAVIGESGQTGAATGPHLHYQVELSRTPIDPSVLRAVSERVQLAAR